MPVWLQQRIRLGILEFYRNDNNQLREQVKDLHEILNGIVKVTQNLHQNKKNQSSFTLLNLSENSREKSPDVTTIDFSINKSSQRLIA